MSEPRFFDRALHPVDARWKSGEAALKTVSRELIIGIGIAFALLPCGLRAQTIPGALPESAKALSHGEWPLTPAPMPPRAIRH
jgi:hypothetical protein